MVDHPVFSISAPAGAALFRSGDPCTRFLRVTRGRVRVQALSPSGRQIVLYRLHTGDACTVTTACLLGGAEYPAEAIAETDVEAQAMARADFEAALADAGFRTLAFAGFAQRLSDVMALLGEVAFERVDVRLARHLLALALDGDVVAMTHDGLAAELGTAREVVSRALKGFEHAGLVRLARGRIEIIARDRLVALSQGETAW